MTTTTALSITTAARVLADVVDAGRDAGLPAPSNLHTMTYAAHSLSVRDFGDVEAWAAWLGVATSRYLGRDGTVEFCEAVAEREGVTFKVATNRKVVRA